MSKVLIVEDEEAIAEIEKDYLKLSGFEVTVKSDGESGLESAMGEDYDICILDVMLPGVDGFEICRQVREKKNIPIIMVSAKKEDIDKINQEIEKIYNIINTVDFFKNDEGNKLKTGFTVESNPKE